MPDVGHEGVGRRGKLSYARLVIEFLIAGLLAFIGFTLQQMNESQTRLDSAVTQLQMTTTRTEAKVDDISSRLDRLERTQDQDQR